MRYSPEHLKSQQYITEIQEWTNNQKMILNAEKTKVMIFNFTNNYQFTTRLALNKENIEIVRQAKLLGVLITDDLNGMQILNYCLNKALHTE